MKPPAKHALSPIISIIIINIIIASTAFVYGPSWVKYASVSMTDDHRRQTDNLDSRDYLRPIIMAE